MSTICDDLRIELAHTHCKMPRAGRRRWRNSIYVCKCGQWFIPERYSRTLPDGDFGPYFRWQRLDTSFLPQDPPATPTVYTIVEQ